MNEMIKYTGEAVNTETSKILKSLVQNIETIFLRNYL